MRGQLSSKRTIKVKNVAWIAVGVVMIVASLSIAYEAWVSLVYVSGLTLWAHRLVVLLALGLAALNGAIVATRLQIAFNQL